MRISRLLLAQIALYASIVLRLAAQDSDTSATDVIRWVSAPFDSLFPSKKIVIVYLFSETCYPCQQVDSEAFTDKRTIRAVTESFIPFRAEVSSAPGKIISDLYNVRSTPTLLFLGGDRQELERIIGFRGVEALLNTIREVSMNRTSVSLLLAKLERNPTDADVMFQLFEKYAERMDLSNMQKYRSMISSIDDIFAITHKERILTTLQRVQYGLRQYEQALQTTFEIIGQLPEIDLGLQYSFIAACYRYLQRPDDAIVALRKIIEIYPEKVSSYIPLVQFAIARDIDLTKILEIGRGGLTKEGTSIEKAELMHYLAQGLVKQKQYHEALSMIDGAIANDPNSLYGDLREDIVDLRDGTFFRNLSVYEVKSIIDDAMVNKKQILVIDVRTQEEFKKGHLINAVNLPLNTLPSRIGELIKYHEIYMIIYCASGVRSRTASRIFSRGGYKRVINMLGGFAAWQKAQYLYAND